MSNKSLYLNLLNKIENNSINIGIIGLGYVGLPLAYYFSKKFKVFGFDTSLNVCKKINNGKSTLKHISDQHVNEAKKKGFKAYNKFNEIKNCDAIIICVPTPLNKNREPDLSYIDDTLKNIEKYIRKNQIICLESTTYPGTSRERILPFIKRNGFSVGKDYFLAYSPEREDPANKNFNTSTIPKVVGGFSEKCKNIANKIYGKIINKVVTVSSTDAAEMTKLLENIHRCVNISLVNEMKIICSKMNIDINEVIDAAATKPFGFVPYYPGPGLGGHCIPIDPFYLTWKAREYNVDAKFIEIAGQVNSMMPEWVLENISKALNTIGKNFSTAKILIIGLAYKKNIEDIRESPSIEIFKRLYKLRSKISYHDPYVAKFPKNRNFQINSKSIKLSPANIKKNDLTLILTDHDIINWENIKKNSNLIVDTRNVYKQKSKKIFKS